MANTAIQMTNVSLPAPGSKSLATTTVASLPSSASSQTKDKIPYQKLRKDEIRLLVLKPGAENEPIQCHINTVNRSSEPAYQALSYMWGSDKYPKYIDVSGATVAVGKNLWNALKSLQLKRKARVLWVDALCINQENIPERNSQVLFMSGSTVRRRGFWFT